MISSISRSETLERDATHQYVPNPTEISSESFAAGITMAGIPIVATNPKAVNSPAIT